MNIVTFILLAIIVYFIWAQFKTAKVQRTNALLVAHYLRTIFLLLDEFKGDEQDLRKQLLRGYVYEHDNTPMDEFNEPWEALATACMEGIKKSLPREMTIKDLEKRIDPKA